MLYMIYEAKRKATLEFKFALTTVKLCICTNQNKCGRTARRYDKRSFDHKVIVSLHSHTMYLLTEWEGRTGKYLARVHGVRTERQIFSRPARPNSVNKHFII